MGKINQGILGSLSSSVGMVTGAVVKGRPTLRRKVTKIVNPNSDGQQQVRSAFGEASAYCRENWDAILAYCDFKEKKGKTIWNQAVSWYLAGGRLPATGKQMHGYLYNDTLWLIDEDPIIVQTDFGPKYKVDPRIFDGAATSILYKSTTVVYVGGQEASSDWSLMTEVADGEFLFRLVDVWSGMLRELNLAQDCMALLADYVFEGGADTVGLGFGTWPLGGTDMGYITFPRT